MLDVLTAFVFACLNILAILILAVDRNAYSVQIAPPTKHAYETNVWTLVRVLVDKIVYAT